MSAKQGIARLDYQRGRGKHEFDGEGTVGKKIGSGELPQILPFKVLVVGRRQRVRRFSHRKRMHSYSRQEHRTYGARSHQQSQSA